MPGQHHIAEPARAKRLHPGITRNIPLSRHQVPTHRPPALRLASGRRPSPPGLLPGPHPGPANPHLMTAQHETGAAALSIPRSRPAGEPSGLVPAGCRQTGSPGRRGIPPRSAGPRGPGPGPRRPSPARGFPATADGEHRLVAHTVELPHQPGRYRHHGSSRLRRRGRFCSRTHRAGVSPRPPSRRRGRRRVRGPAGTAGSPAWAAARSRPCPCRARTGRPGRGRRNRGSSEGIVRLCRSASRSANVRCAAARSVIHWPISPGGSPAVRVSSARWLSVAGSGSAERSGG